MTENEREQWLKSLKIGDVVYMRHVFTPNHTSIIGKYFYRLAKVDFVTRKSVKIKVNAQYGNLPFFPRKTGRWHNCSTEIVAPTPEIERLAEYQKAWENEMGNIGDDVNKRELSLHDIRAIRTILDNPTNDVPHLENE